jgi:hypothetical protein
MSHDEGQQFALAQLQLEKTAIFPKGQPTRLLHSVLPLSLADALYPALRKLPTEPVEKVLQKVKGRLEQHELRQVMRRAQKALPSAEAGPLPGSVTIQTGGGPQVISAKALEDLTGAFPIKAAPVKTPPPAAVSTAPPLKAASWEEFLDKTAAQKKRPKGIKLLYVGPEFGAGHISQAKNLAAAAEERGIPTELIDFHRTFAKPKARQPYERAVKKHLGELGLGTGLRLAKEHVSYYLSGVDKKKVKQWADKNKDYAIVVTMPHLRQAMKDVDNPVHILHTDPKKWTGESGSGWFEDGPRIHLGTKATVEDLGGSDERKALRGLPVHPDVLKPQKPTGLMDTGDYNITISGGALGMEVLPMMRRVLEADLPDNAVIHAVAGKNKKLLRQLQRLAKKDPRIQPHGFAPLRGMMREADLNVIRAHGTTFQETVASGKPAVYYAPKAKMVDYQGKLTKDTAEYGEETIGHPAAIGLPKLPDAVTKAIKGRKRYERIAERARKRMGNPADTAIGFIMKPREEYAKAAAAVPSQEEIFEEALAALPEHIRNKVLHASGGLPDARGDLSDVDMTYYTRYPHGLLRKMPEGTIAERRDPEHTIYTLPGYPREVNLYATMNRARARRAPAHRDTAIALQQQYPELAEAARKLKSGGLGTEKAWAKVLGVEGDPYEEMLNREKMLALAAALQKTSAAKDRHQELVQQLRTVLRRAKVKPSQVTIGGSGVLGALGLKAPKDLDVHVPSRKAWKALAALDDAQHGTAASGSPRVQFDTPVGELEFFTGPWRAGGKDFAKAPKEKHRGILHWTPQHTLDWKEQMGRPKDQADIKLLRQHLKTARAYRLSRRMEFRGLKISVETDKGEKRYWYDPNNKEKGSTTMRYPYGYIRRTEGIDGDHVDVYVGPNEDAKNVYVVHQQKAPRFDRYDEDKCMLGFNSAEEAKKAYLMHYNDDRFFGSMTVMPFEQFKRKVLATFKRPQKIAEQIMDPLKIAYIWGAAEAQLEFDKQAGKDVAVSAIRKKIVDLLATKTPEAVDQAAEIARLAVRTEQMTPKALEAMLKGSKSGDMATLAEKLKIVMGHGKEKALIDPQLAHSWAKAQGKSTAGLPPVYGPGGKPVVEEAAAAAKPAAEEAAAAGSKWQHTPEEMQQFARTGATTPPATTPPPAQPAAAPTTPPAATSAAAPTAAPTPPVQTPVKGTRWQDIAGGAALGGGLGLGGGYLLGKSSAAQKLGEGLGDPMFWQGGEQAAAMPPQGGTAEDAALALPPGIFQGLQMKVNPAGERSTTVKVTPDAIQTPEALQGIFQAEPEAKVEMAMPQASGEGGAGGGPGDMGLPQGMPVDGAGATPLPQVPPKVAAIHKMGEKKTRIELESNPDINTDYPWRAKKTQAQRNAETMERLKAL